MIFKSRLSEEKQNLPTQGHEASSSQPKIEPGPHDFRSNGLPRHHASSV